MNGQGILRGLATGLLVTVLAACGSTPSDGGGGGGGDDGGGGGGGGSGPVTVSSVAPGEFHGLALTPDGNVLAWGNNNFGQLGDGSTENGRYPVELAGLSGITALAAGRGHSLALDSTGQVHAWGNGEAGQLGFTAATSAVPTEVTIAATIVDIAAAHNTSYALDDAGNVWAWGGNSDYNLGDGSLTDRTMPAIITGLSGVESIAVGPYTAFTITESEGVWAWGKGQPGALATGTNDDQPTPARIAELDPFDIVQVSVGSSFGLALVQGGTVVAWGTNQQGQAGSPPNNPVTQRTVKQVAGINGATQVEAGASTSGAIVGGKVVTWGSNLEGAMGAGPDLERTGTPTDIGLDTVTFLALGPANAGWAVHTDGSLHAWGSNDYWRLGSGGGDTMVPVPVGSE